MATRCCWPPESWLGRCPSRPASPNLCTRPCRRPAFTVRPSKATGQRHVLHHVQHRHQVVELVRQPHLAAAEHRQLLVGARVHVGAVQQHVPGGGPVPAPPMRCRQGWTLPEPDDPTIATNSPSSTLKDTSSNARVAASPSPVDLRQVADRQNIHARCLSSPGFPIYGTSMAAAPCRPITPPITIA